MKGLIVKKEIWKYVPGYEGLYAVSHLGRIKRCSRDSSYVRMNINGEYTDCSVHYNEMFMKYQTTSTGTLVVQLRKDDRVHRCTVARIVADAFIPNPYNYRYIQYLDRDKSNVTSSNLVRVPSVKHIEAPWS